MHDMNEKDLTAVSAMLTPENWQEQLNQIACTSARDTLADFGPSGAIELAFALLQTYYMLAYSAALPWLEHDGTLPARIDTLRKIMESCGLEIDTSITTQALNRK